MQIAWNLNLIQGVCYGPRNSPPGVRATIFRSANNPVFRLFFVSPFPDYMAFGFLESHRNLNHNSDSSSYYAKYRRCNFTDAL